MGDAWYTGYSFTSAVEHAEHTTIWLDTASAPPYRVSQAAVEDNESLTATGVAGNISPMTMTVTEEQVAAHTLRGVRRGVRDGSRGGRPDRPRLPRTRQRTAGHAVAGRVGSDRPGRGDNRVERGSDGGRTAAMDWATQPCESRGSGSSEPRGR